MATQRTMIAKAIADGRAKDPDWTEAEPPNAVAERMKATGVACYPFSDGAWALELRNLTVPHYGWSGDLVPTVYQHGNRLQAEAIQGGFATFSSLATDFDGDGTPELFVAMYMTGPEGGESTAARILTVAGDAIAPYKPAESITITGDPVDVDGDGRLDLPTSHDVALVGAQSCDYSKDYGEVARFVAHTRPDGTFSTDDAVAKAFARKWCPASPASIQSVGDALCARLWSSTAQELAANRKRVSACVQWDCALATQPKGAIPDCEARQATFEQTMPFTFP
jgi:hypothetical protein